MMDEKILELLQKMDSKLNGIENELKEVKTDMNTRFNSIENRLDIVESQLNENTQILKALEHKANVSKAEHDKMSFDILHIQGDMTETKESIQEVANKLNTLETVTIDNWKDITKLKKVK